MNSGSPDELTNITQQRSHFEANLVRLRKLMESSSSSTIKKNDYSDINYLATNTRLSTSSTDSNLTSNYNKMNVNDTSFVTSWDDQPSEIAKRANMNYLADNSFNGNYNNNSMMNNSMSNVNILPDNPYCECGRQSVLLTSRQDASLNQQFYCCSLPREDQSRCKFFQWVDTNYATMQQQNRTYDNNSDCEIISPISGNGTKDINGELRRVFGHNGYRHGQKECIEAAMSGRDVFCLMPTGGGKSVVYQVNISF